MKAADDAWSLFRLSDRTQFDRVPLQVVEYLYKLLPVAEHDAWMFWRQPMAGWQPLSLLPAALKQRSAPPAERPTATYNAIEDFSFSTKSNVTIKQVSKPLNTKAPVPASPAKALRFGAPAGKIPADPAAEPRAAADAANAAHLSKAIAGKFPPAVKAQEPMVLAINTGEHSGSLKLESGPQADDRKMVRYIKRFKIKITLPDGRVFESQTVDVSQAGMKLRDPLPEGLPRFFDVEFDCGPEGKILLMCSAIKERGGKTQYRLQIQVNDFQNKLRSALMRTA